MVLTENWFPLIRSKATFRVRDKQLVSLHTHTEMNHTN